MAYQIKYTGSFDVMQSVEPFLSVRVDIYEDGYTGVPIPITMTGTPVIHEWQDDNPFEPIKGSTCKIGIINDGTVSLDDFYSEEDTKYRVEVRRVETLDALFIGYLLQDDCREIQVDFNHEIFLTATDGLGLIKDVTLGEAAKIYGTPTTTTGVTVGTIAGNSHTIISPDGVFSNLHVGDVFYLSSGALQGYWTVTDVSFLPFYDWYINVAEDTSTFVSPYTTNATYNVPVQLEDNYLSLRDILRLCFFATQLQKTETHVSALGFSVVSTLYPVNNQYERWLDDTYIKAITFKDDSGWMSCYDVLYQIMQRFRASSFQAYGRWFIVRWGELWYEAGTQMYGYNYNTDFLSGTFTAYGTYLFTHLQDQIEYGWEKSIDRPYRYFKETYNYRIINFGLLNPDLQELGLLINQYSGGGTITKEYELPYWVPFSDNPSPTPSKLIRIVTDATTGEELERYIAIQGSAYSNDVALQSNNIELGEGDSVTFSFDYRVSNNEPGPVNSVFAIYIDDGVNPTRKINTAGEWLALGGGYVYSVPSGDNVNQWHTVEITSNGLPYNAIMRLFLALCSSNNIANETHYRNFRFTVNKAQNDYKYAIGHVHTDTMNINVKNTDSTDIFIDDAPRPSIAGCLFEYDTTGTLRNKTSQWLYSRPIGNPYTGKLGYLTTSEMINIHHTPRTIYNGKLLNLFKGTDDNITFLSNFSIFKILSSGDTRRFVPGSISIDYKHNEAEVTLHQICETDEYPADLPDYYTFNYIYDNG